MIPERNAGFSTGAANHEAVRYGQKFESAFFINSESSHNFSESLFSGMVDFHSKEFFSHFICPGRSLFSLTVTLLLVLGSANSKIENVPRLSILRNQAAPSKERVFRSVLRLRGSGDDDTLAQANALKELGNKAYKEKNFAEALEHYEKVFVMSSL